MRVHASVCSRVHAWGVRCLWRVCAGSRRRASLYPGSQRLPLVTLKCMLSLWEHSSWAVHSRLWRAGDRDRGGGGCAAAGQRGPWAVWQGFVGMLLGPEGTLLEGGSLGAFGVQVRPLGSPPAALPVHPQSSWCGSTFGQKLCSGLAAPFRGGQLAWVSPQPCRDSSAATSPRLPMPPVCAGTSVSALAGVWGPVVSAREARGPVRRSGLPGRAAC